VGRAGSGTAPPALGPLGPSEGALGPWVACPPAPMPWVVTTVAATAAGAGLTRAQLRQARVRPKRARKILLVCGAGLSLMTTAAFVTAAALVFFLHLSVDPVRTGSMLPAYGPGWAVIMKPIPAADVRPGMIVSFTPPGLASGYVHRVVTVSGSPERPVITTKGDANPRPDPWHAQLTSATVPQVIWAVPEVGRVMLDLQQRTTRVGLMGFGGFSIAGAGSRAIITPASRRRRAARRDPGRGKVPPQAPRRRRTTPPPAPPAPCSFATAHRQASFCHHSAASARRVCAYVTRRHHQISLCPHPRGPRGDNPTNGRSTA